jgi:methylated-DNA-[protein]-cysteine S-methyltransferase
MKKPKCTTLSYTGMDAPLVGRLWLAATEQGLCEIAFDGDEAEFVARLERLWRVKPVKDEQPLAEAVKQLREYLAGQRTGFDLPIETRHLRPFQRQVLDATQAIPRGNVSTYRALALQVGRPRAMRAVGRAEATNPMPLVIPCHRVIGSNGSLRGYGGGLPLKSALLKLEGVMLAE